MRIRAERVAVSLRGAASECAGPRGGSGRREILPSSGRRNWYRAKTRKRPYCLAEAVVRDLDRKSAIDLAQSLFLRRMPQLIGVLQHVGFRHLADLLYLSCESARFPLAAPDPCEIEFEEYADAQRERLSRRNRADVRRDARLHGARRCCATWMMSSTDIKATGEFRPENWMFVRHSGADVGVLLLADHPSGATTGVDVHGACTRNYVAEVGVGKLRGMRNGWRGARERNGCWSRWTRRISRRSTCIAVRASKLWESRAVYVRIPARCSDSDHA